MERPSQRGDEFEVDLGTRGALGLELGTDGATGALKCKRVSRDSPLFGVVQRDDLLIAVQGATDDFKRRLANQGERPLVLRWLRPWRLVRSNAGGVQWRNVSGTRIGVRARATWPGEVVRAIDVDAVFTAVASSTVRISGVRATWHMVEGGGWVLDRNPADARILLEGVVSATVAAAAATATAAAAASKEEVPILDGTSPGASSFSPLSTWTYANCSPFWIGLRLSPNWPLGSDHATNPVTGAALTLPPTRECRASVRVRKTIVTEHGSTRKPAGKARGRKKRHPSIVSKLTHGSYGEGKHRAALASMLKLSPHKGSAKGGGKIGPRAGVAREERVEFVRIEHGVRGSDGMDKTSSAWLLVALPTEVEGEASQLLLQEISAPQPMGDTHSAAGAALYHRALGDGVPPAAAGVVAERADVNSIDVVTDTAEKAKKAKKKKKKKKKKQQQKKQSAMKHRARRDSDSESESSSEDERRHRQHRRRAHRHHSRRSVSESESSSDDDRRRRRHHRHAPRHASHRSSQREAEEAAARRIADEELKQRVTQVEQLEKQRGRAELQKIRRELEDMRSTTAVARSVHMM